MNKYILAPNVKFENNCVYTAVSDIVEGSVFDTSRTYDRGFLSVHDNNRGYLDVAFNLCGLRNVTLDFNGATLFLRGRIQPFIIDDCENITIRNVTVEYDRSFFTEFDIISNENGELRMSPKAKFPYRVENGYLIPYSETWENRDLNRGGMFLQTYDTQSGDGRGAIVVVIGEEIIRDETPPCTVLHLKVRENNGDVILYGDDIPHNWDLGMTAVLSHEMRDKSSVFIRRSRNIKIENYRILNGAGMGIIAMYTENLTLDALKLYHDGRSHGLATNAADAVHLAACKGKITIKNSVFENMTDDAVNIHTNFVSVLSGDENKIRVLKNPASHCLDAYFQKHGTGDIIAVYNGNTMEKKDEYCLTGCRIIGDCETELIADHDVGKINAGDLIENLSTQPELYITDCVFGKANSHLRIQTRGKTVIENCRCSLPVLLTGDTNYWYEASPVNDMTVCGCEFKGNGRIIPSPEFTPTAKAPYYHSGVKIIKNSFETNEPINAYGTDEILFEKNINSCFRDMRIVLKSCGKCVSDNCEVIRQ